MSDENYNPNSDEYLNKLKSLDTKRTELIKINKIVDELKKIDIKKNPIDKIKVIALILVILLIIMSTLLTLKIIDLNKEESPSQQTSTSIIEKPKLILDTSNYIFYISNNVGKNNYFDLKYEQAMKIKELMPDNSIYKVKFVTEKNGNIEQYFTDKDLLIKTLIDEIKSGGDMRRRVLINAISEIFENYKENSDAYLNILFIGGIPDRSNNNNEVRISRRLNCDNIKLYFVLDNIVAKSKNYLDLINKLNQIEKLKYEEIK